MTIARDSILRKLLNGLHRRPVLELTCACLGVLLLAQALIGALSLSALNRLATDTVADRAEVAAQRIVGNIQNGLRLGKPLGQFFGLNDILRDGMADVSGARGVAVVLADGRVLDAVGQAVPRADELGRALADAASAQMPAGMVRRGNDEASGRAQGDVVLAVPLIENKTVAGAVVLAIAQDAAASRALIVHNLLVLFLATALVGFALAVVFKWIVPPSQLTEGGRARFAVPLAALLLAQGIYAASTIATFRDTSLQVAHDSVAAAAAGLQRDLNRVLGYGISPDHLRGVEVPFHRLAGYCPNITAIVRVVASGRVLDRAGLTVDDIDGLSTYPGGSLGGGMTEGGIYAMEDALRVRPSWINGGLETPGQGGAVIAAMLAVAGGLCKHVLCFRTVWEATYAAKQRAATSGAPDM